MKERVLYYCDPAKNVECKKTNCLYKMGEGECYMCKNPKFAREGSTPFSLVFINGKTPRFAREVKQ
jgi:hypothetical protein